MKLRVSATITHHVEVDVEVDDDAGASNIADTVSTALTVAAANIDPRRLETADIRIRRVRP